MYKDKIIEGVWKNRASYVTEHHHDMTEIIEDLMKRQRHTDRTVISRYKTPLNTKTHVIN